MSTRGFICFVIDGRSRTAYCHNDSEPASVGVEVLRWLRTVTADMESLRRQVRDLRDVDYTMQPTEEDIERLFPYARSSGSLEDWDNLLHRTQGNPALILEAGVILDQTWFAADSLHAEWGYVIDVDDDGLFEVYRGRQTEPHQVGRFAAMEPIPGRTTIEGTPYYPVALRASWPLTALPDDDAFLAAAELSEEEQHLSPEEAEVFLQAFLARKQHRQSSDGCGSTGGPAATQLP